MELCYGGITTRLKQRAVTEFLSAVYGEDTVNRTTVNHWAIKFRE
jgi:hypothetical protein